MKINESAKTTYVTVPTEEDIIGTKPKFIPYQYYSTKEGTQFRSEKRIVAIFVPYSECTNRCIFCSPNIPVMEELVKHKLTLNREFSVDEMMNDMKGVYERNRDSSEIVIGGGIGEPLLYFNKLPKLISRLKKEIPLPIRVNTNGQASVILPQYSTDDVCKILEGAGLDSIMISLNAVNEKNYNILSQPKLERAFKSTVEMIKVCNESKLETYVSFLDYSEARPNYPKLDKNEIKSFLQPLGLKEEQIVYRPFIH